MRRSGFSLIEVILATAILLASVFVLSELAGIGRRQSQRAAVETEAQELCERTLLEVLQGDRPLIAVQNEPLLPPGIDPDEFEPPENDVLEDDDQLLIFDDPDEQSLIESIGRESQSEWLYSVRVTPLEQTPQLAEVVVSVKQADLEIARPVSFSLRRWIEYSQPGESDFAAPGFGFTPGGLR